jgi:hypothetical protein
MQVLSRRTGMSQSKIIPVVKRLTGENLIVTRKIKRVTKYKLSDKGTDLLYPKKFPFLFGAKPGRRKKRRRLSRRQRIRRLDYAIGTLVVVIIVLVVYFMAVVIDIMQLSETQNVSSNGDNQNTNDLVKPVILRDESIELINVENGQMELGFYVFDPGESPSGIDANTLRIQYGFASSEGLKLDNDCP